MGQKSVDRIKFLGTAGARFVMARQIRYSAGVYLEFGDTKLMLDPGPGTLLRCARSRPPIDAPDLDGVILTHAHLDHSGDVNVLIDAMTHGGWREKGALFAPADCLEGENRVVLNYLRDAPERVETLTAGASYEIGDVSFSTPLRHRHGVETYGVRFQRSGGDVSFVIDTEYFDGLAEGYAGSRVLVVNVVRRIPHRSRKVQHMTLPEAEELIGQIRPEKAVLTHYGMTMVKAKPWEMAEAMSKRLGLEVLAASDGMTLELPA
jgi:phosphoribosyl 1,2-cyclic phosphodiesterase